MTKPDWITLSKSSGVGNDTIEVSAPEYIEVEDRQGELTVKTASGTTGISGLGTNFVYPFDFVPSTSPGESSSNVLITDVQLQSDAIYEFTLVNQ